MKPAFVVKMSRSRLLNPTVVVLVFAIAALPFAGCRNPASSVPEYDILLAGDSEQDIAPAVFAGSERIVSLAQNPGEELRLGLPTESGGVEVVVLSFLEDSKGDLRPTLTRPDGERAYLRLGLDGLKPVIKFTDREGHLLTAGGQKLIFALPGTSVLSKAIVSGGQIDLREWASVGIAALVGGIVFFVGASVVRIAAVGISYLAVAAILVGGVVIAAAALKGLLELLGWETADILALFQGSLEDTTRILADAVEQFRKAYNV